jgi:hypothetical protein
MVRRRAYYCLLWSIVLFVKEYCYCLLSSILLFAMKNKMLCYVVFCDLLESSLLIAV